MAVHRLISLGPEIFLIKNLLTLKQCRQIIERVNALTFAAAGILLETVDNQIRSTDLLQLNGQDALSQSINRLIMGQLAIAQQLLFQTYGVKFPYAEPCSILRYREGDFYKRHVDNILLASRFHEAQQGIPTRDISIVGYLNDNFVGGETYFNRQDIKVKPDAGAVLIFPAYFTHPHESLPVIQGQKWAFTSWLFH